MKLLLGQYYFCVLLVLSLDRINWNLIKSRFISHRSTTKPKLCVSFEDMSIFDSTADLAVIVNVIVYCIHIVKQQNYPEPNALCMQQFETPF